MADVQRTPRCSLIAAARAELVEVWLQETQHAPCPVHADRLEFRIDTFTKSLSTFVAHPMLPADDRWIVTCRSKAEGGDADADAAARAERILRASEGTAAGIDFELADWTDPAALNRQLKAALRQQAAKGGGLILSRHECGEAAVDFDAFVADVHAADSSAVGKIAHTPKDITATFATLDAMRKHRDALIAIAMGESGLWTRVLAGKLGAYATYRPLAGGKPTAPGQQAFGEILRWKPWTDVGPGTRVFGVLGDPVAHSRSPELFGRWFCEAECDAVYLPLLVSRDDTGGVLHAFLDGCRDRPWLDIGGFSVTIPHKTTAMAWPDMEVDEQAQATGAINTIVLRDGRVFGHNTDCYAAMASLTEAMGCSSGILAPCRVDVLGTGGAARAVVAGLRNAGCAVTVFGRTLDSAERLATDFDCLARPWPERTSGTGDVLIHATSIGMSPDVDASPMPAGHLSRYRLVFDLVYTPETTKLLADAREAGVATLGGTDMFLRQAARQFELWTGQAPSLDSARCQLADSRDKRPCRHTVAFPDRVVFIGMRGSGKSTVAQTLAQMLDLAWADTDDLIIQIAGKTIQSIFESEGEARFRAYEREAVRGIVAGDARIIAVGGGAILDGRNVATLKAAGRCVWLTASADVLWARVASDEASPTKRPPLTPSPGTKPDGLAEMTRVLAARQADYARVADVVIDTTDKSPSDIARETLQALRPE